MITSWTAAHRNFGYGPIGLIGLITAAVPLAHVERAAAQKQAAPAPVRVHLTVAADEPCASPDALAARVRERSRRIEFVRDTGDIPRLRIAIAASGTRDRVAELALEWPDGRHSERTLKAASCAAALDALALLVAMTLDPAALGGAQGRSRPSDSGSRNSDLGIRSAETGSRNADGGDQTPHLGDQNPNVGAETAANPNSELRTPDSEVGTPDSEIVAANPEIRTPRSELRDRNSEIRTASPTASASSQPLAPAYLAAGLTAQLSSGPAPRAMPGLGLYAQLAFQGAGVWAPTLELQLIRTWVDALAQPGGDADFALELAELDACPLGAQLSPLAAHACVSGVIGRMTATGSNSYAPQTHHELWTSLGGTLLLSLGLGRLVEMQAGFGLVRPLRRFEFAFRPDVFHRVPALCWHGHLGAGVRFP